MKNLAIFTIPKKSTLSIRGKKIVRLCKALKMLKSTSFYMIR
ncbi:MAG: hypothetical protein R6T98_04180 [Desulfatiglandales bacterium]